MGDIATTRQMQEQEEELPLDTFHATITGIDYLDRNRHKEVQNAFLDEVVAQRDRHASGTDAYAAMDTVAELLADSGQNDWEAIEAAIAELDDADDIGRKAALVKGREEQPYSSLMELRFVPGDGTDDGLDLDALEAAFFEGRVATDGGRGEEERIEYIPGQHFGTRVKFDDEKAERVGSRTTKSNAYSIASAPTQGDEISLLIKRIPPAVETDSSMTPLLFEHVEEGDELVLHGPYTDELMLHDPSPDDMVFMATGTGIAPLKSMIDYAFDEGWDTYDGEDRDVWLFLGAKWKDWLPYHDEFEEMAAEHDNFHYVPTLSREGQITDYRGADDYIQFEMLKYVDEDAVNDAPTNVESWMEEPAPYDIDAQIDPDSSLFYLCGVTAMVESVRPVFDELGVPEARYQAEPFG